MTTLGPLSALFAVAALPFALVCCTKDPPPPPPAKVDPGTRLLPNPEANPEPFLTVDAGSSADASATTVDASLVTVPPPPVDESPAVRCAAAMRDFSNAAAQAKTCKVDDDCTILQTSCGLEGVCGMAVAKKSKATLEKVAAEYQKGNCWAVVHAPCPSCVPPKPPACVAGRCK